MRYWKGLNLDASIRTVESYSHDLDIEGAIEIDEVEFNAFVASLPVILPVPERDLAQEIDELKARLVTLELK